MKRRVSFLIALVLSLFIGTSTVLAGGAPPTTFDGLANVAQNNEDWILHFYQTGTFDESDNYWAGNQCLTWMYMVDNIDYYFQNETTFVAKASTLVERYRVFLLYRTDATPSQKKSWQKAKKAATLQIQQMAAWHSEFENFKDSTAMQNRGYYCSVEQMCQPEEPLCDQLPKACSDTSECQNMCGDTICTGWNCQQGQCVSFPLTYCTECEVDVDCSAYPDWTCDVAQGKCARPPDQCSGNADCDDGNNCTYDACELIGPLLPKTCTHKLIMYCNS